MTWEEEIQAAWSLVCAELPGARLERCDHSRAAAVVMPDGRWKWLAVAPTSDHVRHLIRDLATPNLPGEVPPATLSQEMVPLVGALLIVAAFAFVLYQWLWV